MEEKTTAKHSAEESTEAGQTQPRGQEDSANALIETLDIDPEERLRILERAERAIDTAHSTGRADRAKITRMAQLDAAEAVAMAGVAMESDEAADEATRFTVIAESMGDQEKIKAARKRERAARKQAKVEHKAATKSAKRAYNAIKFSAPNKMGFIRAVQVLFALHIASYLVFLVVTSRDAMTYDSSTLVDWVVVALEAVAFWLFINRYKIGRPVVMGMAVFGLAASAVSSVMSGSFNPFATIFNEWFFVFLLLYFGFSKRVRAVLVNDISLRKGDYDKNDFVIERRGWPFYRNLIIYFILFSVLGHWMEMAMCQLIIAGVVQGEYDPTNTMLWRDWLYPFPMEGAAVVIIALVLYPLYIWLKKKIKNPILPYVLSFLANALTCTIIEFGMGLIVNADLQLWDYTENFGNIMGQVCLQNTAAFGVSASLIAWFVYPMLERWIARVPRDIMNIVFVVVLAFGAIIWSLYIVEPPAQDTSSLNDSTEAIEVDITPTEAELGELAHSIQQLENNMSYFAEKDRPAMQEHVAQMKEYLQKRMGEEGIQTLPTEEQLLSYKLAKLLKEERGAAGATGATDATGAAASSSMQAVSSAA